MSSFCVTFAFWMRSASCDGHAGIQAILPRLGQRLAPGTRRADAAAALTSLNQVNGKTTTLGCELSALDAASASQDLGSSGQRIADGCPRCFWGVGDHGDDWPRPAAESAKPMPVAAAVCKMTTTDWPEPRRECGAPWASIRKTRRLLRLRGRI